MSRGSQLACAWLAASSIVLLFVGFFAVSGYVPPRPASDSAQAIADFYRQHTDRIRIGLAIMLVAWAGWGPLTAVMSTQMLRIEGDRPVLTILQAVAGTVGWVFLLIPEIVLMIASFRPERSPEATQTLHDLGWFLAFIPLVPFCVQAIAIAVAILGDRRPDPVFPRWAGYFSAWAAVAFSPAILMLFFKTGPFSYQGVFVFWIPMFVFGAWILVLAWAAGRAAARDDGAAVSPRAGPA